MRVRHRLTVLGLALIWPPSPGAADVFRLPAQGEITHAEVFIRPAGKKAPSAVVVLCPGQNGSAEDWLRQPDWQAFAERHNLALAGLYFQSRDEDLQNGRGYFVASRGAGKLLEEALSRAGLGHLPIFLYGFSGGAHFAASYAAWHPEKVLGFCAYSFGWWKAPPAGLSSPALIVCGQADGARYGATFAYFQAGRRQGKPWAWVSLEATPHAPSGKLEHFVRSYIECLLASPPERVIVNNLTKRVMDAQESSELSTSVLPRRDLLPAWRDIHYP